ncbi:hypothetical protein BV898_00985 [Hypsibius exemplaris]|uniref:Protein rolling stone n=1 Tax=Hypsibius exemplaris TaxID=2072580 RepID=A0A1W0XD53_HYPEX|nr:hypothetical protein BV898_00985 [Hypsibius exemplaris]
MPCCATCSEACREEFHWRRLFFGIKPADRWYFTHPQWTFIRFSCFVVWKVLLAVYFVVWLGLTLVSFIASYPTHSTHEKWLIYLTNWTYLFFVSYVVVAAINVLHEVVLKARGVRLQRTWHFGLQWFLWNVGAPATVVVVILFWAVLVPSDSAIVSSAATVHVHLINGVAILVDLFLHAMPMQLLHMYQPLVYAATYAAFTGIYFASNGTDPAGNSSIYPIITDYSHHTGLAVGADFAIVLIVIPTAWLFLWSLQKLRIWLYDNYDPHWNQRYDLERAWKAKGPTKMELAVVSQGYDLRRNSVHVSA